MILLDVRTKREYCSSHVCGAVNIPMDVPRGQRLWSDDKIKDFWYRLAKGVPISRNTRIYVYCAKGVRSSLATKILLYRGYHNVQNLGPIENVKGPRCRC